MNNVLCKTPCACSHNPGKPKTESRLVLKLGPFYHFFLFCTCLKFPKNGRIWEDIMCFVPRIGTLSILCHLMLPLLEGMDGWRGEWGNVCMDLVWPSSILATFLSSCSLQCPISSDPSISCPQLLNCSEASEPQMDVPGNPSGTEDHAVCFLLLPPLFHIFLDQKLGKALDREDPSCQGSRNPI